jgi:hypothetical protein
MLCLGGCCDSGLFVTLIIAAASLRRILVVRILVLAPGIIGFGAPYPRSG